jgi:hypothetical protein
LRFAVAAIHKTAAAAFLRRIGWVDLRNLDAKPLAHIGKLRLGPARTAVGIRFNRRERLGKARRCGLDSNSYVLYLFFFVTIDEARPVMEIHYTALPFVRLENGGLVPGEAVQCPHSTAVIRRADRMVRNEANAGAVALARIESPRLGEFEEAVILKTFGDVPDDFDCARV